MQIFTYLENHEATKRKNHLVEQSAIRTLTDEEKEEQTELIKAIRQFEDEVLLNFE